MYKNSLNELISKERKEYFKEWRARNKDKVKKNNENYWKKRAEKKIKECESNEQ